MDEGHVGPPQIGTHLASRLEEGLGLDVTDRAADLGDDDVRYLAVRARLSLRAHDTLDLVSDVRDDLDGVSQVLPPPFLGDHAGVDLPGGGVGLAGEVDVKEALVVADVQVRLRSVLGDKDLPVLEGVHRAGVDVDIRVKLLHRHADTARAQQSSQAGGRQPLTEGRDDATGDEDVGRDFTLVTAGAVRRAHHGTPSYR